MDPQNESQDAKEKAYQLARLRRAESRRLLIARLEAEGADDLASRLEKCGIPIPLVCTGCGEVSAPLSRCDRKWCPSCAPKLAAVTVAKYKVLTGEMNWPLFVTFTTENYEEPDVRPLRRAWGKLRRLRWFKSRVKGGVAAFECTNNGNGWHWHIHALIDCHWLAVDVIPPPKTAAKSAWVSRGKIAAKEVAEQWELCTGRKSSVHVRRVWKRDGGDVTKATGEVLKYAVTAESLLQVKGDIAPMLRLLAGTRLVTSFGSCFGKAPKAPSRPPLMCKCGCSDRIPEKLVPHTREVPPRMVTFAANRGRQAHAPAD